MRLFQAQPGKCALIGVAEGHSLMTGSTERRQQSKQEILSNRFTPEAGEVADACRDAGQCEGVASEAELLEGASEAPYRVDVPWAARASHPVRGPTALQIDIL